MNEYLINSGEFNIIVRPLLKEYYILEDDITSSEILKAFVDGQAVQYSKLQPLWFKYASNESWKDFDKKEYQLGIDFTESDLINLFVLKKFNFGSLVAVRDAQTSVVKVFKRNKIQQAAMH